MSRGFSQSGNLASQIQQYASLYAIAKKTGKQLVFPQSTTYTNLETSPPSYGLKFADLFDLELQVLPDESLNDFITYELEHKLSTTTFSILITTLIITSQVYYILINIGTKSVETI